MDKGPEIRAFRIVPRMNHIGIFIEEERKDAHYIAAPMDFVKHELLTLDPPPTISLSPTAAQQLIDDLWDCGLRPSEGSGSAGQLAAVERHLADMQRLVFEGGEK
jgi:hypothetical protein